MISTARGTVLAFCEGGKLGRSDSGVFDLLVRGRTVSCQVVDGANGRVVGRCVAGKYDLAQWLVKQGWLRAQALFEEIVYDAL